MSKEFGWAYVVGSQASGPRGSVQLAGNETALDHDPNLIWSDELNSLLVSGNIIAHNFEIQNQTKTVFEFEVSGSSIFGDTPDDLHQFTGSVEVSGNITAKSFIGYGGDLIGVAINEYTNPGDNRIITSVGEKSVHAEDNLSFDGSLLSVTGNVQAVSVYADELSGSIGLFDMLESTDLAVNRFTDGTITIETGSISNVDHFSANTLGGVLTTPEQPNITQVGTLNSLTVANDASFNATFYVKTTENRIGVNVSDPLATEEILSSTTQLRLTSQRGIFGIQDYEYTDLFTDAQGNFSITPSNNLTTIEGNAVVTGDLLVSGTFTARMTDFNVSADTLTFGDEASDTVIVNASTMQAPNGLAVDSTLFISSSTVGVGDYSSGSKFEVTDASNQMSVGTSTEKLSINVTDSSTTISTTSQDLDINSRTKVLNEMLVGANGDIVLNNAGEISSSVSVSSDSGYFNNLQTNTITNGNVAISENDVSAPIVNATLLNGTIQTPTQPNITSLGTLDSLSVSGDASFGLDVLTIDSTNKKVGVSKTNPQKKFEIKDTDTQLRLTNTEYVFGISQYQYVDLKANATGDLEIIPKSGKVVIPNLELTNIQQGSSNTFLSLDPAGNVILSPAVQSGVEVRNRTVVTGSYQVLPDDYFVALRAGENLTVTLPDSTSMFNGQIMVIKDEANNADVYDLFVSCQAGQTIDGTPQIKLASPGSAINFYTDGQGQFFIF